MSVHPRRTNDCLIETRQVGREQMPRQQIVAGRRRRCRSEASYGQFFCLVTHVHLQICSVVFRPLVKSRIWKTQQKQMLRHRCCFFLLWNLWAEAERDTALYRAGGSPSTHRPPVQETLPADSNRLIFTTAFSGFNNQSWTNYTWQAEVLKDIHRPNMTCAPRAHTPCCHFSFQAQTSIQAWR